MRFLPTIATDSPETVRAQPGQWIAYGSARGRFMGVKPDGSVWIAWGGTAARRFQAFADAFHGRRAPLAQGF